MLKANVTHCLAFFLQGERSTLGAMSLGSLSQSSNLSPRRSSRSSLGGSRSSLRRSNENLPAASRSATADAIFMEEFGKGRKEAAAPREGNKQTRKEFSLLIPKHFFKVSCEN